MSESRPPHTTSRVELADTKVGFSSGHHALDDYFARHAVANDVAGISRAYVLRRSNGDDAALPLILGFYTLSMASAESSSLVKVLSAKTPRYPLPVALIGSRTDLEWHDVCF